MGRTGASEKVIESDRAKARLSKRTLSEYGTAGGEQRKQLAGRQQDSERQHVTSQHESAPMQHWLRWQLWRRTKMWSTCGRSWPLPWLVSKNVGSRSQT